MRFRRLKRNRHKAIIIDNLDFVKLPKGYCWLGREFRHNRLRLKLRNYIPDVHGNYPKISKDRRPLIAVSRQVAEDLHKYYRIKREDIRLLEQKPE